MAQKRSRMKTKPAKGKKGGQPSGIADKVKIKEFLKNIRRGHHVQVSAKCARIATRTVEGWMKRGLDEMIRAEETKDGKIDPSEQDFVNFTLDVQKAEGESERDLLNTIRSAGKKQWTAAAWILERTKPKRYAKWYAFAQKERLPEDKTLSGMTEQELDAELEDTHAELKLVQQQREAAQGTGSRSKQRA